MRFTEIGQQLRAYRLESGLRAEEIAARLGVSRAALYRYEKGEVIKLDTIKRLAELLKISPLSLLGIGVEYYSRMAAYLERLRQIEESADQILQNFGPLCYLATSESYDSALAEAYADAAEQSGADRSTLKVVSDQALNLMAARKKLYLARRPNIIAIFPVSSIVRFLQTGVAGSITVSDRVRRRCRQVATTEIENVAALMASEPMGIQFGLHLGGEPNGSFKILRGRDRATLCVNPFRTDIHPATQPGVAMITGAEEAIGVHQRIAEQHWREAVKGPAAAAKVRELITEAGV